MAASAFRRNKLCPLRKPRISRRLIGEGSLTSRSSSLRRRHPSPTSRSTWEANGWSSSTEDRPSALTTLRWQSSPCLVQRPPLICLTASTSLRCATLAWSWSSGRSTTLTQSLQPVPLLPFSTHPLRSGGRPFSASRTLTAALFTRSTQQYVAGLAGSSRLVSVICVSSTNYAFPTAVGAVWSSQGAGIVALLALTSCAIPVRRSGTLLDAAHVPPAAMRRLNLATWNLRALALRSLLPHRLSCQLARLLLVSPLSSGPLLRLALLTIKAVAIDHCRKWDFESNQDLFVFNAAGTDICPTLYSLSPALSTLFVPV